MWYAKGMFCLDVLRENSSLTLVCTCDVVAANLRMIATATRCPVSLCGCARRNPAEPRDQRFSFRRVRPRLLARVQRQRRLSTNATFSEIRSVF